MGRDLSHIGNVLCDLGRLDDAANAFREAQAIDSASLGADHVHTATDGAAIGIVLATQHKWREATPHLEAAGRALTSALDAAHPNVVAIKSFLAECHERTADEA